ncbi:MAG: Dabb family protein [Pseudomonadota bacterium]|nr:Dabb family protein [Pseudomonadota bacterium]
MLRHIVLMKLKEGVGVGQIDEMSTALHALPAKIAVIKGFEFGPDILGTDRSYDFALAASFESVEDLKTYQLHPDHVPVLQLVRSLCDSLIVVDFNWP